MKKALLTLIALATLTLCGDAWAATLYLRDDATTWASAASWSNVSSLDHTNSGPCTASDDCIADATSGSVTIGAAAAAKSFDATAYLGTLTHNAFTWTVSGNLTFGVGMTYTPLATSTLSFNQNATLITAGKLMPLVASTGGALTLGDNLTFMDSKVMTLTLSATAGNRLIMSSYTVAGNSLVNRILVRSATLGSSAGVNVGTGTFANADFRDIALNTSTDLSAITGLSGDCGGNTNITFTTAATQTYTGGTGSWSDASKWTSRVPLPQDDVSMSGVTGGTITADMPRLGKSIDWTGASGSPTVAWNGSSTVTNYGSLTLISGMTNGTSGTFIFEGRSSFTLTTAGKGLCAITSQMVGGTLTLQDAVSSVATQWAQTNGTLNTNNFNFTAPIIFSSGSVARGLTAGSSVITLSGTGTVLNISTSTNFTMSAGSSTILISDTSASSKTFAGGGLTYNDLKIAGGGAGAVILTGANTFNRIYTDGGGTKSITLPGSTTTTILSGQGLNNGTNVVTFTASAGTATISKSGAGDVEWPYVHLTNIAAAQTNTFYAPNSTNNGGNTNWIFGAAPSGNAFTPGLGLMMEDPDSVYDRIF